MSIEQTVQRGRAFIDGTYVADVEWVRSFERRLVRVPMAGRSDGYKDVGGERQAFIRFADIEASLRGRLQTLADGLSDEQRRAARDAQRSAGIVVDLALDEENLIGVTVQSPYSRHQPADAVDFPAYLPQP